MRNESAPSPLRLLCCLVLALALAACGTKRVHERSSIQGQSSEWHVQGSVAEAALMLTRPRVDGDSLSFAVQSQRTEHEIVFDIVVHESRRSQDANLFSIAAGVTTLGLYCLVASDDCFGKTGQWRSSDPERTNPRPSGRTRPLVEAFTDKVGADVLLQGFDGAGSFIGQAESRLTAAQGRLQVPVKTLAEQLPRRPATVRVTATLRVAKTEPAREALGVAELGAMKLAAEHWLPASERQAIVIGRLKTRLLQSDHARALDEFAALEALGVDLPASFLYMYAQSLIKTGAREKGQDYLQRYIVASGEQGTYAAEARAQIARLARP